MKRVLIVCCWTSDSEAGLHTLPVVSPCLQRLPASWQLSAAAPWPSSFGDKAAGWDAAGGCEPSSTGWAHHPRLHPHTAAPSSPNPDLTDNRNIWRITTPRFLKSTETFHTDFNGHFKFLAHKETHCRDDSVTSGETNWFKLLQFLCEPSLMGSKSK